MRPRPATLTVPAAVLGLALLPACGGGGGAGSDLEAAQVGTVEDTAGPTAVPAEPGTTAAAQPDATAAGERPDATAAGERPARDECISLPEAPDGLYQVADVGSVTVTVEGDRLVLGEVSPAEGWEAVETEEERDEVEVEFRADGEDEIDFEAELEDDGGLAVEVCNDDD